MRTRASCEGRNRRWTVRLALSFLAGLFALFAPAGQIRANPDVYAVLPEDTHVVQYGMGDLDGDTREELAVFYTSGGATRLALFKSGSGHWSRWWEDDGLLSGIHGASPGSVELVDATGDGKDEIVTYYLTEGGKDLVARILAMDTSDPDNPSAAVILEDTTTPPGYPLFGSENGSPSVTFLKIPLDKGDVGHRRVYCWDGERFVRCVEVPWHKP